jgi:hypothetical protein
MNVTRYAPAASPSNAWEMASSSIMAFPSAQAFCHAVSSNCERAAARWGSCSALSGLRMLAHHLAQRFARPKQPGRASATQANPSRVWGTESCPPVSRSNRTLSICRALAERRPCVIVLLLEPFQPHWLLRTLHSWIGLPGRGQLADLGGHHRPSPPR